MKNSQTYAVEIEHIMSNLFDCERFGVGGVVNSDRIRKHPYLSIASALTFKFASASPDQREKISSYLNEFDFYWQWSIDFLLSIEEQTFIFDDSQYSISYPNGEIALKEMINQFKALC